MAGRSIWMRKTSNYLNKNFVLNNTNIVVNQFDYSVFNQKMYADVHIIKNQEMKLN